MGWASALWSTPMTTVCCISAHAAVTDCSSPPTTVRLGRPYLRFRARAPTYLTLATQRGTTVILLAYLGLLWILPLAPPAALVLAFLLALPAWARITSLLPRMPALHGAPLSVRTTHIYPTRVLCRHPKEYCTFRIVTELGHTTALWAPSTSTTSQTPPGPT